MASPPIFRLNFSPCHTYSIPTDPTHTFIASTDYGVLLEQLRPCASKWEAIAAGLRFTKDEIDNIKADHSKMAGGPESYLGDVIGKWLHWAPGDARGSEDRATLEAMRRAVNKAGFGDVAGKLTLKKQDGNARLQAQSACSDETSSPKGK